MATKAIVVVKVVGKVQKEVILEAATVEEIAVNRPVIATKENKSNEQIWDLTNEGFCAH